MAVSNIHDGILNADQKELLEHRTHPHTAPALRAGLVHVAFCSVYTGE